MDENNDNCLSLKEFAKTMHDFKINLTENEFNTIFDTIDYESRGLLPIPVLMDRIRVCFFFSLS